MSETYNLLPDTPDGHIKMLVAALRNKETYDDMESHLRPYANCMIVVQELMERGELTQEEADELIEAFEERDDYGE